MGIHRGHASCGSGIGASRFLIGLVTSFATHDGILAVAPPRACAARPRCGPARAASRSALAGTADRRKREHLLADQGSQQWVHLSQRHSRQRSEARCGERPSHHRRVLQDLALARCETVETGGIGQVWPCQGSGYRLASVTSAVLLEYQRLVPMDWLIPGNRGYG